MTNAEIIASECAKREIEQEVHTFAKWKSKGFKVKKGEKALFDTMLWKFSEKGKPQQEESSEVKEDKAFRSMYMTKSYLFGESQVERIEDSNGGKD